MLNLDQAREIVVSQLALDFRAHNAGELIEREIEREWGWLFLYPDFGGGPPCAWLVNRHNGEIRHLSQVTSTDDAVAQYERTLNCQSPGGAGPPKSTFP